MWQRAGGKSGDIREGAGDNRAVVISFRACTLSALCPLCLSPWEGSPSTGQGCWGAVVGREKPISHQGLPGAGSFSEQKGHGTMPGAGTAWRRAGWGGFWTDAAEHSLLSVPVDCVVIAPWTFPCLPEPLHGEPGTPLHLLPCRGGVVGNTASTGSQQSPLPGCQPLTEDSDPGGRVGGHRCCTPQRLLSGIRLAPGPEDVSPAVLQISMNSMISRCALHPCNLRAWIHVMAQPGSSLGTASPAPRSHPESPKTCLR